MTNPNAQQQVLRKLLKNGSGSSLFNQLGINKLGQMRDFELMYQSFTRAVPVASPKGFMEGLHKMAEAPSANSNAAGMLGILNNPNLLVQGKPLMAAWWRGVPVPVGAGVAADFLTAEAHIKKQLAAQGQPLNGEIYYLTETEATKREAGLVCGNLLQAVASKRSWWKGKGTLPNWADLPDSGGSRLQGFNLHLDQLKTHGARVAMLAVAPKTLVDFCLYVSQQAGRFVPLKELCPNLTVLAFNGYDPGVQRTELSYILAGLEGLKWLQWVWQPCGLHMWQNDINIRQRLDVLLDGHVFYEFVPAEDIFPDGRMARNYRRLHAGLIEAGREYALLVSTTSGLLAVSTGLLVKVLQVNPLRVSLKGPPTRLHGLGENVREDGVVEAIANINMALQGHGVFVRDALLGHVLTERQPMWVVEVSRPLAELDDIILDSIAKRLSSEIELRFEGYRLGIRQNGVRPPQVYVVPMGTFAASHVQVPEFTHFDFSADATDVKKRIASAWESKMITVVP